MAKRARIIMLLSTLCLCIGLLVVGVFATVNVNFNVTSSLNFENEFSTYFTYDESIITGLSDEYLSLGTKPETLIIPSKDANGNTITSIGSSSSSFVALFEGLESSNVIIEEGIINIGNSAFYDCDNLISITLPNTLKTIGSRVFQSCSNLTNITLPGGLESIGDMTFSGCNNLIFMNYLGTISQWCEISFANMVSNPTYCTKTLNINGEEINDLVIPDNVETIGDYAFYNCTSLTSVNLPSSITRIGDSAFSNCNNLTSMNYLGTLSQWCAIDNNSSPTSYTHSLYINGEEVTGETGNLVIPEGVVAIVGAAFASCNTITSVTLPNSITSIGARAFINCTSLTGITIPEGVETIGDFAFYYCTGLKTVNLPSSLTSVGTSAFYYCTPITTVNYSGTIEQWCAIDFSGYESNPTYYSSSVYINGKMITGELIIPEGVETIKGSTFTGFYLITSVVLPESLKNIGGSAFQNCTGLTSINIPKNVETIGRWAFYGCRDVEEITVAEENTVFYSDGNCLIETSTNTLIFGCQNSIIPDTVVAIGDGAFSSCRNLTSLVIPSSVTSIWQYALSRCTSLTSLAINTKEGYVWQKSSTTTSNANWETVDVSDPVQNANWFKNSSSYYGYYWRQIEESLA